MSQLLGTAIALALALVVGVVAPTNAAQLVSYEGVRGSVLSYGGTICNPFMSSGFARNLVDIGGPLVADTPKTPPPPNTVQIGDGAQQVYWKPWLEKYVNGTWVPVWVGQWYLRNNVTYQFPTVFVDVRNLGIDSGSGYFRSGAAIQWVADATHPGGRVTYRHSGPTATAPGDYFKDAWANLYVAKSTPVNTPYCYAGQ